MGGGEGEKEGGRKSLKTGKFYFSLCPPPTQAHPWALHLGGQMLITSWI